MKSLAAIFLSIVIMGLSYGQGARMVFNGAFLNIENGAHLVIDNSNPNAVTRTVQGGHIISESENDVVRWNIGSNNGAYFVPFGVGTSFYLPLFFTTDGGVGNGYMELATYGGPDYLNSSYLPTDVNSFTGFAATDNSPYVMDRFWKLKARDYANANQDRPSFHLLTLSYRDSEHANVGNVINEADVFIQRYNPVLNSWYDFIPGGGVITSDIFNNTVSVNVVPNDEIFDWWAIVSKISPLPVDLLTFTAQVVQSQAVFLEWVTAHSNNMRKYVVERSTNGIDWEFVLESAAINAADPMKYSGWDEDPYLGLSYYRLKLYEDDGTFSYSTVRSVVIEHDLSQFTFVYPNPSQYQLFVKYDHTKKFSTLSIYDMQGRLVGKREVMPSEVEDVIQLDVSGLPQGSYVIQLKSKDAESFSQKFIKL